MELYSIKLIGILCWLGTIVRCASGSFLLPVRRLAIYSPATAQVLFAKPSRGTSSSPQRERPRNKRYRGAGGGPSIPGDFLEDTKWGRIRSPDLFVLFDPSKPAEDSTISKKRTKGLANVKTVRILNSILNSWARAYRAPDAGARCHEVIRHLEKHKCHMSSNVFLYNVVINAYARRGRAEKAEEVLRQMMNAPGIEPNIWSFSGVMNAWSKSKSNDAPERCKGLLDEMALLASSTNNKDLTPDTVAYNTVIDAYARRGQAEKAEKVLREMLSIPGIESDEYSFACVMNAWSKSEADDASERCKGLLDEMALLAKSTNNKDLTPGTVTYTTVIDAYARRGRAEAAEEVFREMLSSPEIEPNVKSFTSVMNAWSKSEADDAPERCKGLLDEMALLASSTNNKDLTPNTVTYNTVIDAYARRGRPEEAEEVLRAMLCSPEIDPDVNSFNSVMNAWSKSEVDDAPERCKRLLDDMTHLASSTNNKDLTPDTVTYNTLIDAYARRGRPEEAEEVLRAMLCSPEIDPDVKSFNSVMNAWSKSEADDAPERCKGLLDEMTHLASSTNNKDLTPDTVTYTTVIDAYARRGRAQEADKTLRTMLLKAKVVPDVASFNSVMNAWSKSDAEDGPERCKVLLATMDVLASSKNNNGIAPNTVAYNSLIDAYARRGRAQEAEETLRELLNAPGVEPDVLLFSSVMNAWSKSDGDDAPHHCHRILSDMMELACSTKNTDLEPDEILYQTVFDAYKRRGRAKDVPKEILRQIAIAAR